MHRASTVRGWLSQRHAEGRRRITELALFVAIGVVAGCATQPTVDVTQGLSPLVDYGRFGTYRIEYAESAGPTVRQLVGQALDRVMLAKGLRPGGDDASLVLRLDFERELLPSWSAAQSDGDDVRNDYEEFRAPLGYAESSQRSERLGGETLQRLAVKVRITASDADSGAAVWAGEFDRTINLPFDVGDPRWQVATDRSVGEIFDSYPPIAHAMR